MKHEVIDRARRDPGRIAPWPRRQRRSNRSALPGHSAAATRFAEICGALGGTTMLRDLMPDLVTVSFGSRTAEIRKRLHARGWHSVGAGDWAGEPVLGVSFSGNRRADGTVDQLADALISVVAELEIAETRIW